MLFGTGEPMTHRVFLFVYLLVLTGCSMRVAVKAPVAPDVIESAKSWAYTITQAFPNYAVEPISRYEQPELLAVGRDLLMLQGETDQAIFVEEVDLLRKDWGILVALDNTLQQESVI